MFVKDPAMTDDIQLTKATANKGKVLLVGAGPGDPEFLTRKAMRVIQTADVVVFDRLVSPEIIELVPQATRCIDVGKAPGNHKLPQEDINTLLVELAGFGLTVARLKGGEPMIFGRGSEEASALHKAGVSFEYIPGITSAQGAAAATGVPLTHRGCAFGVRYVTGHRAGNAALDLDWASLANEDTTLVIYMGAMNIAKIASQLIRHGMASSLPVMAVSAATTPRQRHVFSDLSRISTSTQGFEADAPVLFVIGHVVSLGAEAALGAAATEKVMAYA